MKQNREAFGTGRGAQSAADLVAEIRKTHPDWPGDDVRAAAAAILQASMPATLDGAA